MFDNDGDDDDEDDDGDDDDDDDDSGEDDDNSNNNMIMIIYDYNIIGVQQLWHDICDYAMKDTNIINSRQNSPKQLNKTTISNRSISAAVLEHRFASFVRAGVTNRNVIINRFKSSEEGTTSRNKTTEGVTTSNVENKVAGGVITSIVENTEGVTTSIVETTEGVTTGPISNDSRKVTWGKNRRSLKRREVEF